MSRALVLTALVVSLASCGDDPSQLGRTTRSGSSGKTSGDGTSVSPDDDGSSGTGTGTGTDGEAQSDSTTNRAHGAFGKCGEFAQNECPGWAGPATTMIPGCLKAMYGEGPGGGHYEAMVSTKYTKVSCGFGTAAGGAVWSVQNFR